MNKNADMCRFFRILFIMAWEKQGDSQVLRMNLQELCFPWFSTFPPLVFPRCFQWVF